MWIVYRETNAKYTSFRQPTGEAATAPSRDAAFSERDTTLSETDTTNPETGVDGQQTAAPADDIETEAFDRAPAPDDDAETDPASGEDTGDDADADKPQDAETFEFETEDGAKHKVPAVLKDALLRHADYTKKTQEIGETRRQLTEAAQALETQKAQQAEAFEALRADHIKVGQIEAQHADLKKQADIYREVDWAALQQQDPDKYDRHRAIQRQVRDSLIDAEEALTQAKTELSAKEAKRLEEATKSATADLAKRREETKAALEAQIPGWDKDKATAAATLMVTDFGITPEEIGEATDPRLWKIVHALAVERAKNATLSKTRSQQQTADNHAKAQTTIPAKTTSGAAAAAPRDPSKATGDRLSTAEWMRRRNAQEAKARSA
jgi:hypothetical protein